jgi:hypothetical protein
LLLFSFLWREEGGAEISHVSLATVCVQYAVLFVGTKGSHGRGCVCKNVTCNEVMAVLCFLPTLVSCCGWQWHS